MKARIHSFESFGTVDGPGIRFVIFFQGCCLKCKYCHNRDMWETGTGQEYTVQQLVDEVSKYKQFFKFSGGGVTASGGEPLLQAPFIAQFFKRCRDEGITTALDTSGALPLSAEVKDVLAHTDIVLLDIKHIDSAGHLRLTGVPNEHTLAMARYLSDNNIKMRVRYVVVPGYSDADADIDRLATFLLKMKNLDRVDVLPYHELGKNKWEVMGIPYELDGVHPPTAESLDAIVAAFETRGITAGYSH